MSFYRLTLKYNGHRFQGWQKQPHTELTVQGQLNKALSKISKSKEVKSIGSGRTDSGVHALAQVVRIEIPLVIAPEKLVKALNSNLPDDIECLDVKESDENFHPVFGSLDKTYRYIFSLGKRKDPLLNQQITFLSRKLDLQRMQEACELFIGEYNFADFFTTGTEVATTVREVYHCSVTKMESTGFFKDLCPEYYVFEVRGNGFLKQMVRLMIATVWNVGEGKVSKESLAESLRNPSGNKLAAVAPPQGLYLANVTYNS